MEELKCSVCGSPVNAGDSFCQNCGNPIQPQKQEETVIPEPSQPVSGVTEPTSVVMPEVTEPTVAVTPEITEPTPVVETTETIEAVQPTYEAVSAQPEEKPAANPFTVTEKDTATAQAGTYQQGAPQPQAGTYQQGVPQPQQAPYQQAGTYQEPYYGQQTQMGVQQPQKQKKPGKAAGIVGLIFGILGLLTSACGIMVVPLIFCLVGIILAIVCLTKNSSKGLGISGMIVSALGLISGLIFMFLMVGILSSAGKSFGEMDWEEIINTLEDNSIDDDFDYVPGDYDPVYTEDGFGAAEEVLPSSNANLTDVNQIMINGTVYTLPVSFESTGFSVNEKSKDDMDSLATDGWDSGEYHFVLLDSADGYSVWGFIENTSDSTVYSESDLKLTGLNVDNYSSACTATSVKIANGVTFGTSKSEVVSLLGDPDSTTDDGVYYDSADGKTELYLEYDGDDKVQCIEITVYED
ncbi:MAG: hypothetical protein PUA92_00655 [Clostridium sp.]|nr:hypothetical protein [Clostridium sp.]